MARKSDNPIPNMNTDWGLDPTNGLPYSGQSVQSFIKQSFNEKVGAASFDQETMTIYLFKDLMDRAEFEEDHEKKTLAIGTIPLQFGTVQYRIKVTPDNGKSINATINQESVNLDMDLQVESREIGEMIWVPTGHDIAVRVFVDAGNTGTYIEIPSLAQTVIATVGRLSVDVRRYIQTGNNRVRLFFSAVDEESISSSIVFDVSLAEMYIEPFERSLMWHRAVIEDDMSNDYSIGGFKIVGNILKTLHIDISTASTVVASYSVDLMNFEYIMNAYFFRRDLGLNLASPKDKNGNALPALTTGIYNVKVWLTSGNLSTEDTAIVYNIMYIASGEQNTAKLVVMNNSGHVVNNYDESAHLCDYAIYNAGQSYGNVSITITPYQDSTPISPYSPPAFSVATEEAQALNYGISLVLNSQNLSIGYRVEIENGNYEYGTSRIDNSEVFQSESGATFYLNTGLRSNGEGTREVVYNTANNSSVAIQHVEWVNMSWVNGMDGWTVDDNGRKCLLIPARSRLIIPPSGYGFLTGENTTFEFSYKVSNVSDYTKNVISIAQNPTSDGFMGIRIKPTNITLHSGVDGNSAKDTYQGTNLADEETVHVVVTIQPSFHSINGKNLVTGYLNGVKNFQFEYTAGTWANAEASAIFGSDSADLYLYMVRVYNGRALSDDGVEKNFLNSLELRTDKVAYKTWINSILRSSSRDISYEEIKNNGKYNFFVVEMTSGAGIPCKSYPDGGRSNIEMHFGKDENGNPRSDWDWKIYDVETKGQGTTSMNYWLWNLRFRIDKTDDSKKRLVSYYDSPTVVGNVKTYNELEPTSSKTVWFDGQGNHPAVKRITAKINFASSMQSHKMGATRAYNILHDTIDDGVMLNEAQVYAAANDLPVPTVAVYQYPAFGFQKIGDDYVFIGLFTIGPDKGDKPTFGYDLVAESLITLEGTDHNQSLAKFSYPWIESEPIGATGDVSYYYEEEGIAINRGTDGYFTGFEITNCHDKEIDAKNKDNKAYEDQPLIRSILDTELKPAYELVWNNSTLIFPITSDHPYYDTDASTTVSYINNHLTGDSYTTNFRLGQFTNSRLTYADMQFWVDGDSTYTLYYYDEIDKVYKAGVSMYDQNGTPTGSTASEKNEWFKEQRRERFMESAGDYFDLYDTIFHYVFLLIFGATDNFAKNMYPYKMATLANDGRWRWRQDDLDTIEDIDNNGGQTKSSDIEFEDSINGSPIFAGSNSVLWTLVHECFWSDFIVDGVTHDGIKTIGKKMIEQMSVLSNGTDTYDGFIKFFDKYFWGNAQEYFSPSAYNIDGNIKYEAAWLNNGQDLDPLRQSLGNHYLAEKLWVRRRALYCMSMFGAGTFGSNTDTALGSLAFRPNQLGKLDVTVAESMYPCLIIGARDIRPSERIFSGGSYEFTGLTGDTGNTRYYLQAMDYITSLGDLKNLQLGNDDGGQLTLTGKRLKDIKIGDATSSTTNIATLSFGTGGLPCLEKVDVQNAPLLSGSLNLSLCKRIKEVYAEGTDLSSVDLPRGSKIEVLHLPDNVTRIEYRVIKFLYDLDLPDDKSGITHLYLEECDALDGFDTLEDIYNNTNGQNLQFIKLLWNTETQVNGIQVRMLAHIMQNKDKSGSAHAYHGYDSSGSASTTSNPHLEGRILANTFYLSDITALANGGTPTNSTEHPGMKRIQAPYFGALYITYNPQNQYIDFDDQDTLNEVLDLGLGDGEGVTLAQAAAVTDLNSAFKNNANIGSFDEFKYFTGVTNIASIFEGSSLTKVTLPQGLVLTTDSTAWENAFKDCSSLVEVDFCDAVRTTNAKNVRYQMFSGCHNITKLHYSSIEQVFSLAYDYQYNYIDEVPFYIDERNLVDRYVYIDGNEIRSIGSNDLEGLTTIPAYAFYGWNRLTSVTIPNSVTSIGNNAFAGCTSLPSFSTPATMSNVNINVVNMGVARFGTVTVNGNLVQNTNANPITTNHVVVNGNIYKTGGSVLCGAYTITFKVNGNVECNSGGIHYSGSGIQSQLSLIEITGTFTGDGYFFTFPSSSLYAPSGCIIHLAANQIAATPAHVFTGYVGDNTRVLYGPDEVTFGYIYVGDGSSVQADQAVYDLYAADTGAGGWNDQTEGGTSYMSKVKMWSEYLASQEND